MTLRKVTDRELADLSDEWENPKVDTRVYYQTCVNVWEVDRDAYESHKNDGVLCQIHNNRFYVGC